VQHNVDDDILTKQCFFIGFLVLSNFVDTLQYYGILTGHFRGYPLPRGGHAQLFFESATAIPQLEGRTSAIAIPQLLKEMLLCNPQLQNSAIAIFSEVRNFKSAT
jgi:hypothetical protein